MSKKGLKKGKIRNPKNYKDRLMLTDVGEAFMKVVSERGAVHRIKLKKSRSYFPWSIKVSAGHLFFVLKGEVIGDSTWQSFIEIVPEKNSARGKRRAANKVLRAFRDELGRPPVSSPYWSDDDEEKLFEERGVRLEELERIWTTLASPE